MLQHQLPSSDLQRLLETSRTCFSFGMGLSIVCSREQNRLVPYFPRPKEFSTILFFTICELILTGGWRVLSTSVKSFGMVVWLGLSPALTISREEPWIRDRGDESSIPRRLKSAAMFCSLVLPAPNSDFISCFINAIWCFMNSNTPSPVVMGLTSPSWTRVCCPGLWETWKDSPDMWPSRRYEIVRINPMNKKRGTDSWLSCHHLELWYISH